MAGREGVPGSANISNELPVSGAAVWSLRIGFSGDEFRLVLSHGEVDGFDSSGGVPGWTVGEGGALRPGVEGGVDSFSIGGIEWRMGFGESTGREWVWGIIPRDKGFSAYWIGG